MQLCRSNASTAVCLPTDPRVAIAPTHIYDHMRYSRLNDARRLSRRDNNRSRDRAVTLPMVTKTEKSTRKQMATCADVYLVPTATATSTTSVVQTHEQAFQVVVLRVSIHCQGCAAKVKKHISKMEGVTSYSVDLESKRVTVTGHVSAAIVLESISKIKKAELWIS